MEKYKIKGGRKGGFGYVTAEKCPFPDGVGKGTADAFPQKRKEKQLHLGGAGIHLVHVGDEVQELVGVAPLVIVPGDELDEVVVLGIASFFRYADQYFGPMVIPPQRQPKRH